MSAERREIRPAALRMMAEGEEDYLSIPLKQRLLLRRNRNKRLPPTTKNRLVMDWGRLLSRKREKPSVPELTLRAIEALRLQTPEAIGWNVAKIRDAVWSHRLSIYGAKAPRKSYLLQVIGTLVPVHWGPAAKRRKAAEHVIRRRRADDARARRQRRP
jgi:hypothetical protein